MYCAGRPSAVTLPSSIDLKATRANTAEKCGFSRSLTTAWYSNQSSGYRPSRSDGIERVPVVIRHEVTVLNLLLVAGPFGQFAGLEGARLRSGQAGPYRDVLLTAHVRQKQSEYKRPSRSPGLNCWPSSVRYRSPGAFKCRVNVPGATDELMEPEREEAPRPFSLPASMGGKQEIGEIRSLAAFLSRDRCRISQTLGSLE